MVHNTSTNVVGAVLASLMLHLGIVFALGLVGAEPQSGVKVGLQGSMSSRIAERAGPKLDSIRIDLDDVPMTPETPVERGRATFEAAEPAEARSRLIQRFGSLVTLSDESLSRIPTQFLSATEGVREPKVGSFRLVGAILSQSNTRDRQLLFEGVQRSGMRKGIAAKVFDQCGGQVDSVAFLSIGKSSSTVSRAMIMNQSRRILEEWLDRAAAPRASGSPLEIVLLSSETSFPMGQLRNIFASRNLPISALVLCVNVKQGELGQFRQFGKQLGAEMFSLQFTNGAGHVR
jgi:hypothetical protein